MTIDDREIQSEGEDQSARYLTPENVLMAVRENLLIMRDSRMRGLGINAFSEKLLIALPRNLLGPIAHLFDIDERMCE